MKNPHSRPPKSAAAVFIAGRIYHLQGRRSQQEIASAAGFKSVNMLSMISHGKAKLPLERVIALAKALECDPRHLMRLALEQNLTQPVLDEIFASSGGLSTANEQAILQEIRRLAGDSDPVLTPELKKALRLDHQPMPGLAARSKLGSSGRVDHKKPVGGCDRRQSDELDRSVSDGKTEPAKAEIP